MNLYLNPLLLTALILRAALRLFVGRFWFAAETGAYRWSEKKFSHSPTISPALCGRWGDRSRARSDIKGYRVDPFHGWRGESGHQEFLHLSVRSSSRRTLQRRCSPRPARPRWKNPPQNPVCLVTATLEYL